MSISEKYNNFRYTNNQKLSRIKLFLSFVILLVSFSAFGQNGADSLLKDTSNNIKRIFPSRKDSTKRRIHLNKIFSSGDTSINSENKISPKRAAIYSAILPGLGQAYNKKYWKIPVVYSIFTFMLFVVDDNNDKYKKFKNAYLNFDNNKPDWLPSYYTKDQVKSSKDLFRRDRDLSIIVTAGFYLLNILDANVDAHMMDYDISEDLSLRIQPDYHTFYGYQSSNKKTNFGLKFVLSF
jgi:hypothetical protein